MNRAFAQPPVIIFPPSIIVYQFNTALTTQLPVNTGAAVSNQENNLTQKLAQRK